MEYLSSLPKSGRLWKSKADFFRPFRTAAHEAVGENITPLYDPAIQRDEVQEPNLQNLNSALSALIDVFPDVQPEVFREMLLSVSEQSRLQIVTEHLLQQKAKWVQGRFRTTGKGDRTLHVEHDSFRTESYKRAVKQVLYLEFRNLSHSTVKGVLAEENFSYTRTRPVLQQVASRSWRFSFSAFWGKKGASWNAAEEHPYVVWQHGSPAAPAVRSTGSLELDHELHELFVAPLVAKQRREQMHADHIVASNINEAEAEEAEALFDCGCCYSSVPFEKTASCDKSYHYLCLDCIRRNVNESLYGQGWARTADLERATVRCFAPTSEECNGCVPRHLVWRALSQGTDNEDTWTEFQNRITTEILLKSGLILQRCPFCDYAEIDEVPSIVLRYPAEIWSHFAAKTLPVVRKSVLGWFLALLIFTLPILILVALSWVMVCSSPIVPAFIRNSLKRVHKRRRGSRFSCRNPTCLRPSCTRCTASWHDPHICFESEKTSLRTAVEASATAAIKRTCPRCFLSFVKSSGCNKLVCNCGYTMCYVCRQEITSREGYAHFCQHFRPNGGRCGECERCDLYGDEDEDVVVRRAAEEAERLWRENSGEQDGKEGKASRLMVEVLIGEGMSAPTWYEAWVDEVIDAVVS